MDDNDLSPERPTKKADTPPRSILSSTTDNAQKPSDSDPWASGAHPAPNPEIPDAFVELMELGASPNNACQQTGLSNDDFWKAIENDVWLSAAVQRAYDGLSHNIVQQLYSAAMKGNVTAQQFWLRQRPATLWSTADDDKQDPLEQLNDHQLADACRAAGIDLPPEIETRLRSKAGGE